MKRRSLFMGVFGSSKRKRKDSGNLSTTDANGSSSSLVFDRKQSDWSKLLSGSKRKLTRRAPSSHPLELLNTEVVVVQKDHQIEYRETSERDEESSASSASSLLSSYYSSSSVESCYRGLDRLQKKFAMRDRLILKLGKGKSKAYKDMLWANELAAREVEMNKYKREGKSINADGISVGESSDDARVLRKASVYTKMNRLMLFESQHVPAGVALLTFYTFGNVSFYNLTEVVLKMMKKFLAPYISEASFHFLIVVISLLVMRASGYLWAWLPVDPYSLVKFELHNRERLGFWDARILSYFKRNNKLLGYFINMVSFYVAYVGLAYFYDVAMELAMYQPIQGWYHTVKEELLKAGSTTDDDFQNCETIKQHIAHPLRRYFGYHFCHSQDQLWESMTILYDILFFVISVGAFKALGLDFFEFAT